MQVTDAPLADLAGHLERAVREAGALALGKFGSSVRNWTKDQNSPVSEADIEVDRLLYERLKGTTPDYGWLSEESTDDPARLAAPRVWVVDPIDGTRGFIAGRPDWAVSAALVEGGRPILGVLFAPVTDEIFVARAGQGATRNGAPMRVHDTATLAGARIAGPPRRLERLTGLAPGIETVPKIFSLALRLNAVAAASLDVAMAGPNSHDWDLAAADLLVHEAGGVLTDIDGRAPLYNEPHPVHRALFAAGPARHAALLGLLRARPTDFA